MKMRVVNMITNLDIFVIIFTHTIKEILLVGLRVKNLITPLYS
jgi:hypothetical protein